uniref:ATP synthase F0 subunit 8 n=1 Tax=Complanledra complana TaxID=3078487 RepID=A0AAU6PBW8_9HEMI
MPQMSPLWWVFLSLFFFFFFFLVLSIIYFVSFSFSFDHLYFSVNHFFWLW